MNTGVIISICVSIALSGMTILESISRAREIPWIGAEQTLDRASSITDAVIGTVFSGNVGSASESGKASSIGSLASSRASG